MDSHTALVGAIMGALGILGAMFANWFERTDFDVSFRIKTKARR
jgi:hypothetical protein